MTRKELNKQILDDIKDYDTIILDWTTSLGKSKMALDICNNLKVLFGKPKILLIVAEIAHKDNWKKEFIKWGYDYNNVTIECYASLKKYINTSWDIVIMDEAHHIKSDIRTSIFKTININKLICLSATIDKEVYDFLYNIRDKNKIFESKISLQTAIDWNILTEPDIRLIPLSLNNTIKDQEIIEEWGKKTLRKTIYCDYVLRWNYLKNRNKYPNLKLIIRCTQAQKCYYLDEKITYWQKRAYASNDIRFKNKWLQQGSLRKRFLGESKTPYIKLLLEQLKNHRYICFCSSIEQAELLNSKNCIHSKKTNSLDIIDDFNNKKINNLLAINMLQEGQNLVDIEMGIITQLDGQIRIFKQKLGRSLRAEYPIQYIFYYRNTRDEDYLKNVLKDINNDYITEIKL